MSSVCLRDLAGQSEDEFVRRLENYFLSDLEILRQAHSFYDRATDKEFCLGYIVGINRYISPKDYAAVCDQLKFKAKFIDAQIGDGQPVKGNIRVTHQQTDAFFNARLIVRR